MSQSRARLIMNEGTGAKLHQFEEAQKTKRSGKPEVSNSLSIIGKACIQRFWVRKDQC